nr:hypothetical protein [Tanacetum cinerariifolium]
MSSDNASSAVTYTSMSFDSDGPLWGISLIDADELSEMDPYEEVARQGQVPPLSPAYVPDPMESMEEDSIDYPDEPEDDDEDLEEDLEEDHTDYPADGGDGDDEPSNDDDDDGDTNDEDDEPTKDEDDNDKEKEHIALTDSSTVPVIDIVPLVRDTEEFDTDESAPTPRSP